MDFSKWRHTALWFQSEGNRSQTYYHVRGSSEEFAFEERQNYDPQGSGRFEAIVAVGWTMSSLTVPQLTRLMRSVPVNNHDPEFNCQNWVELAMLKLVQEGLLTKAQYEEGFDKMCEKTIEARDESIA